jgi:DNA-binding FadR family transcriptional regulator
MTAVLRTGNRARPELGHNLTLGLVEVLGHAIVAGEFPQGALPTEPELEAHYGVSRSVVREAVKMLAAKGLVVTRPRQGTVIEPQAGWSLFDPMVLRWMAKRAPALEVLRQLCEFSLSVEPAAAALAARSGSARDHAAITAACDALGDANRQDARATVHRAIVAASGNVFYAGIGEAIGAAHRVLALHATLGSPAAHARYRSVARAIERRAADRARQEMADLLEYTFTPILEKPAAA